MLRKIRICYQSIVHSLTSKVPHEVTSYATKVTVRLEWTQSFSIVSALDVGWITSLQKVKKVLLLPQAKGFLSLLISQTEFPAVSESLLVLMLLRDRPRTYLSGHEDLARQLTCFTHGFLSCLCRELAVQEFEIRSRLDTPRLK